MNRASIAAICFDDGQNIDGLFKEIASSRVSRGEKIHGALQMRGNLQGECHCSEMDLLAIGSDRVFRISQPLGQGSTGCRLHPGALAECSAYLQQQIEEGSDLLILNRFGKGESEGRGFRDLMTSALDAGIPILIAVRPVYQTSFHEFAGGFGMELPFDMHAIDAWLSNLQRAQAA